MSVLKQLSDVVENFVSTVEEIERAIDNTDWDYYRKQQAHSILIRLPAQEEISNRIVTWRGGAYLKEIKIKFNVLDILEHTNHNEDKTKIYLQNDSIDFASGYVKELLSDMNKYSKIITFRLSGWDATKFPYITYNIFWEF